MRLDRVAEVERAVLSEGSSAAVLVGGAREREALEREAREREAFRRSLRQAPRETHSDTLREGHPKSSVAVGAPVQTAPNSSHCPAVQTDRQALRRSTIPTRPPDEGGNPMSSVVIRGTQSRATSGNQMSSERHSEALRAAPPRAPCTCLSVPLAASPARRSKHSRRRPRQSSWLATR